ncbi:Na+/H+ antiporter NhaC family protein [Kistimonas scapharcae]|uniref:Na+/H+ antiporter NhaC family protein n=1 Tax=Kistimonas scapharcae TaxID=1036133 RepID=A0ABP8V155_9GAMM
MTQPAPNPRALLPLLVFLGVFFGSGIYYSLAGVEFAFYQVKAPVAALPAIIIGMLIGHARLNERIQHFLQGIGDINIVTMCMVYLLAGAFAKVTSAIGGVDATVALGLSVLPEQLLLPGLFLVAAFVSTAMGTSMGTIAAITPIAIGISQATGLSPALCAGTVVGGAMFGDNLSIISDTTIAATRTQGCSMRDKFRLNARIAIPAALLTMVLLFILGHGGSAPAATEFNGWLVLPYLLVLGLAVSGMNVLVVLMVGILFSGFLGMLIKDGYSMAIMADNIYLGFEGMLEIMVLSMFIGGLAAVMRHEGGLVWLTGFIQSLVGRFQRLQGRAGEIGISLLVSVCNLFTANNTVAILISGSVARDIAEKNAIDPRRSASLLDMFSCVVQGIIPWGAQLLLAGSIAGLSPLALVGDSYYPWILALCATGAILSGYPRLEKRQ